MYLTTGTTNHGAMTWEPDLQASICETIPTNATLVRLAAAHPPPQSWWDDDDDPTELEDE